LEKRITVGQEKFDKKNKFDQKNLQTYVGKKIILKGITMLKKNLSKQNVQTVLAVGPRKNSKN
jgi:hypothetical protein